MIWNDLVCCDRRSACDSADTNCLRRFSLLVAVLVAGCETAPLYDVKSSVNQELMQRTASTALFDSPPGEIATPPLVRMEDGLGEDEAVRLALWNNAAFRETLAELGISSAQLFDAGLLSDPQFTIFLPLGPKQLEFTTFQAVDLLWLQPIRVRAAELDLDRVGQSMVQNGLDTIRDARVAHANLLLAMEQAALSREAAALREEIAALAQKRLDAGDISELELMASRIDAIRARVNEERASHDVTLARERLRAVIGLTLNDDGIDPVSDGPILSGLQESEELLNDAVALRPDLRAAEIGIDVAGERAGLARNQFMNLDAIYDANSEGQRGSFESGPGARLTIPIFNRNQGGIAIADAQFQRALRRYITVRDQVVLEVRTAHTQLKQAQQNLVAIRDEVLPSLREAESLARSNYENGGVAYLLVLQATGQYLDARNRELQLVADVRRAAAELDRAVGHRVSSPLRPVKAAGAPVVRLPDPQAEVKPVARTWQSTTGPVQRTVFQPGVRPSLEETRQPATIGNRQTENDTERLKLKQPPSPTRLEKDVEHVEVRISIRLDPRLLFSWMRPEAGRSKENSTGED